MDGTSVPEEEAVMFTCRECGATGDPPACGHFMQAWSLDQIAAAHRTLSQVTWEDLRKQALHCPILSEMFAMQRHAIWETPEQALLWVALMLSEARIRALDEHAQTLARQPVGFEACWKAFEGRHCRMPKGHEGDCAPF